MKRWIAISALVLAGPSAAVAQAGLDVRITPRAGIMTPADWFYVEYAHFGVPPVEWTESYFEKAPVVGLGVEVEIPNTGVWIRGEVVRTLEAIMIMRHVVLIEASGFEPARTQRTPYRVAASLTTGTLDLALPTVLRVGPVQPYVTAGLGASHYGFDTDPFSDLEGRAVLPQSGTVFAMNVGVGATVRVLGVALDIQVRDALTRYWDRLQHNVMVLGGVTWEVF